MSSMLSPSLALGGLEGEWAALLDRSAALSPGDAVEASAAALALAPGPAVPGAPAAAGPVAPAAAVAFGANLKRVDGAVGQPGKGVSSSCLVDGQNVELTVANRPRLAAAIATLAVRELRAAASVPQSRGAVLSVLQAQLVRIPAVDERDSVEAWTATILNNGTRSAADLCNLLGVLSATLRPPRGDQPNNNGNANGVPGDARPRAVGRPRQAATQGLAVLGPLLAEPGRCRVEGDPAWSAALAALEPQPVPVSAHLARDQLSLRKDVPFLAFNRSNSGGGGGGGGGGGDGGGGGWGAVVAATAGVWAAWSAAVARLHATDQTTPEEQLALLAMPVLPEPVGAPLSPADVAQRLQCSPPGSSPYLADVKMGVADVKRGVVTLADAALVRVRDGFGADMDTVGVAQFDRYVGTPTRWYQPLAPPGAPRRPFRAYFFTVDQMLALVRLVRILASDRVGVVTGMFGAANGLSNVFASARSAATTSSSLSSSSSSLFPLPAFVGPDAALGAVSLSVPAERRPKVLAKTSVLRPSDPARILARDPYAPAQCPVDLNRPLTINTERDADEWELALRHLDLVALESLLLDTPTLVAPPRATSAVAVGDSVLFQGFGEGVVPPAARVAVAKWLLKCAPGDDHETVRRRFLLNAQHKALSFLCPLVAHNNKAASSLPVCLPPLRSLELEAISIQALLPSSPSNSPQLVTHTWSAAAAAASSAAGLGSANGSTWSLMRSSPPPASGPGSGSGSGWLCGAAGGEWAAGQLPPSVRLGGRRALRFVVAGEDPLEDACVMAAAGARLLPAAFGLAVYVAFARELLAAATAPVSAAASAAGKVAAEVPVPQASSVWQTWSPSSSRYTLEPGLIVYVGLDASRLALVQTISYGPTSSPQHIVLWEAALSLGYRAAASALGLDWARLVAEAGSRATDPYALEQPVVSPRVARIENVLARLVFEPIGRYALNVLRSRRLDALVRRAYLVSLWPAIARRAIEPGFFASNKAVDLIPTAVLTVTPPPPNQQQQQQQQQQFALVGSTRAEDHFAAACNGWTIALMAAASDSPPPAPFCFLPSSGLLPSAQSSPL